MTKTKVTARQLPLDQLHRTSGATMIECDGWSVPTSYGDELFEYAAVRERGAGLIDLSCRGRLLVTGSEAVAFLNGLLTNDMKTLAEHNWMPAVFPNVQGRLLASVRVIRLADSEGKPNFLIDTEAATHDRVLQTIERFTLAGDFHITDLTATTALLSLQGKAALDKLNRILGSTSTVTGNQVLQTSWQERQIIVVPATHSGAPGFDLLVVEEEAALLWQALVTIGARPVGHDTLEILRIEAGVPRYGPDMDDTTVVTETNLDDAVSYTKGCYVGQEIIARIKYRGHVAKKLRGLAFGGLVTLTPHQLIKSDDDKEIGHITSTTYSPILGQHIALGYIKYDHIAAGTSVKTDNGAAATVVDLPFIIQIEKG